MELRFVRPLVGFEHLTRFDLGPYEGLPPFSRLVARDDADVSFALLDPSLVRPDYLSTVAPLVTQELGLTTGEGWKALCLVTSHPGGLGVNLAAPVVVLEGRGEGAQLVLASSGLPACQPVGEGF